MHRSRTGNALRACAIGAVASLFAFANAFAQTTVGAVRGHVTGTNNMALGDVQVVARDPATNVSHSGVTNPSGFYYLGGLRPASYEITVRRLGYTAQTRIVRVQIGQTLDEDFNLAEAGVTLSAAQTTATRAETRPAEGAANASTQQVETLPPPSRNFLDLAQLSPGVTVTEDRVNG